MTPSLRATYQGAMKITLNGEARDLPPGASIADLLSTMELAAAPRIAVEVNQTIVPRSRHPDHRLSEGDAVEVVTFVGGG